MMKWPTSGVRWKRVPLALLPRGGMFDYIFVLVLFVYAHRRIPRRRSYLFNDYLFFLKTSAEMRRVERQFTSDKIWMKSFVARVIGEQYVLPVLDEFHSVNDVLSAPLSVPCVIKPAHSSGDVVFVHDPGAAIADADVVKLERGLRASLYRRSRERNYEYLRPRLVCEPLLPEAARTKDYKVFCYHGEPRIIQVDSNRHSGHRRNLYDIDWNPLAIEYNFPVGDWELRPPELDNLLTLSRSIAKYFTSVRVDWYITVLGIYVGELTHCPESANGRFTDLDAERVFSKLYFGRQVGRR